MGYSTSVYVGPYLEIKVPTKEVPVYKQVKCCGESHETSFCPSCGKRLERELLKTKIEDDIDQDDFDNMDDGIDIDSELSLVSSDDAKAAIWIANSEKFKFWSDASPDDYEDCRVIEISLPDINNSTVAFEKYYRKHLETIRSVYKSSGKIKYGVVSTASY